MFCQKCGAQVDSQAAFCDKCGTALAGMRPAISAVPTAPPGTGAESAYPPVVQYAGFWKRFAAAFIDALILGPVSFLLEVLLGVSSSGLEADTTSDEIMSYVVRLTAASGLSLVAGWLYYALMESSRYQATLGKLVLGIVVTDMSARRVSFGRATGRHFAKIISQIILLIGYFMIAFTPKKQGLHDIIAGTLVVNKK